ncbi:M1 family metallopeptidase [Desulfonatronum thiosulfatophilum]|nr:M1 family aminopeptidase [Desulfonatronum thiosulfatophilum]
MFLMLGALMLPLQPGQVSASSGAGLDLRVQLDLQTGILRGHGIIRPKVIEGTNLDIFLHPAMEIHAVQLNNNPVDYRFENGRLRLNLGMTGIGSDVIISLRYSGRFHDPVPMSLFTMDNPGFGVSATITEQGVFFQGQSGWFPRLASQDLPITLEISAPLGILAVTSGRLLEHVESDGKSISRWQVDQLGRGMPLSAGRYIHRRLETDTVPVFTYFFPDNDHLSEVYLQASARHLALYEELHGPYPFDHFAVVENFFPSGFGMPSYTLLGSAILRLPFIPEISLRHEIAHCWWGNGVYVDYSQGNWSEGLTTYVADYLAQEEQSEAAAREYRVRILRDYALLAAGASDIPVASFLSRSDPATQVIGYGKSMFLLHMIRQRLGDEAFWDALRAFYTEWLFSAATWQDMFAAFQDQGWDAQERKTFTRQWLQDSGAPVLHLEDVQVAPSSQGWQVSGVLAQQKPFFDVHVPLRLETTKNDQTMEVALHGAAVPFVFQSPHRPTRLHVDPDHHVFRLLASEEIPPTVNSVRGAADLTVVQSDDLAHVPDDLIRGFTASLNQPKARIITEREAQKQTLKTSNLLFFGFPRSGRLQEMLYAPHKYDLGRNKNGPSFKAHPEAGTMDTIFLVLPHAGHADGIIALFSPARDLDTDAIADTARRIRHYGKDSYLGFLKGENKLRGTWPAPESPLIMDLAG